MSFDHIGFNVADFSRSKEFYLAALAPLGIGIVAGGEQWRCWASPAAGGCGSAQWVATSLARSISLSMPLTHEQVRQFYDAAIKAGGHDNGPPGLREYGANYYAAFVLDPDGHNVEAVCRAAE